MMTDYMVKVLESEAAVSVYTHTTLQGNEAWLVDLKDISGIGEVTIISQEEAYDRMAAILGEEAQVLQYFQENPFSAFIELEIDLRQMETVLETLKAMPEISSIRDNRDILEKLREIVKGITIMSGLLLAAVGTTTLVALSHTIRQSIYHYREQIMTLTLLGAPKHFIAIPFYVLGIFMSLVSGILAIVGAFFVIKTSYQFIAGPIPFIPLPPMTETISGVAVVVVVIAAILGVLGCMLGMVSVKKQ